MDPDRFSGSRDVIVVGGGAGGLAAARASALRGLRTALIHEGRIGGDCTFTGCVPSKSLIEAAARGQNFEQAMSRLHEIVEQIAATEGPDVLEREGIEVIEGRACFVGERTLSVDARIFHAKRIILATGSAPIVPSIEGLGSHQYLTNENIFELSRLPRSLVVVGGGAIGCELAQAFRRFGADVHVVEAADQLLAREEPEASAAVAGALAADGVDLHLQAKVEAVGSGSHDRYLRVQLDVGSIEAEKILLAVGRRAVTDGLDPGAGGVGLDEHGYIRTDRFLRTTADGIFAVGDVTGRLLFTHAADEMGRIAVRNAHRRIGRSAFDEAAIPWVTFTDPEVARVGLIEAEAVELGARVAYLPLTAVDRAVIAGRTEGFVKLIAGPRRTLRWTGGGVLLGATIVSPRAGEMIHEVSLAMRTKMFTGRLAQTVHAYPTWSTALRQAAAQFFIETDGRVARPARVASRD
jgi:pyruvate/2-oxoglutarate dehydrogenase complex dihydrolipoamide dehydrogenase (E3) component